VKEYRVKVTVRNNLLLSAIEDAGFVGWGQLSAFARHAGVQITTLQSLVAMRTPPINDSGEFSQIAKTVMEVLGAAPLDLWTDKQLTTRLNRNTGEFYVDEKALHAMIESNIQAMTLPDPSDVAEQSQLANAVQDVLKTLTDREQQVLALRLKDETYDDVGKHFDVTRERVRQIEAKAFRRLRMPSRSRQLRKFLLSADSEDTRETAKT
jgi:RNA polymerase sigma factor (sigma-70 family)